MVSITDNPIDVQSVLEGLRTPQAGAIDVFIGTVRNHSAGRTVHRLEYTAYVPMAERMLARIENETRDRWSVYNVVIIHRIGLLNLGDVAVVTAISSAHRDEAFAACRYAIDRTKSIVPIWKKEYCDDGEMWVEESTMNNEQ